MNNDLIMEMKGVTKIYPGVVALDSVDFKVHRGKVHALMGENGAGKSTLIKVLTGVIKKDAGEIILDGEHVEIHTVHDANRLGISAVYQELDLIPELSIGENIFLGREFLKRGLIDWKKTNLEAEKILSSMGINIEVTQRLSSISTAMQQMVSIARAISINAKLVVLDEPTSSLDTSEVEVLFKVIENLKSNGIAVIFITHRLDEVFEICDEMTILKDGKLVDAVDVDKITRLETVSKMIGRDAESIISGIRKQREKVIENDAVISGRKLNRFPKVNDQDIDVHKGEILGLAGLLGSGRTELARLLFGADTSEGGTIEIKGKRVKVRTPRDTIARNVAFCSEDRKIEGIIPHMSVKENITLASLDSVSKFGCVSKKKQNELIEKYIKSLRIKVADVDAPISSLSGGNQQKVILARWLCSNPELLILDEPTRGIDVGAKKEILDLVEQLAEEGISVLMISSILDELVKSCDRIQIIRDGNTIGELKGDEIDEHAILNIIAEEE